MKGEDGPLPKKLDVINEQTVEEYANAKIDVKGDSANKKPQNPKTPKPQSHRKIQNKNT